MDSKFESAVGHASAGAANRRRAGETSRLDAPALAIAYRRQSVAAALAEVDTLAVIAYGAAPAVDDVRCISIGLEPAATAGLIEVWQGSGPVSRAEEDGVRYAHDDQHLYASIELDESRFTDLAKATATAYSALAAFTARCGFAHVLRIWNYFDAINSGQGDGERYKQFCKGRAAGMDGVFERGYPAATAIGRRDGSGVLQVYWLAARSPGKPIENPRQTSAYRYPRQYGPAAPSFARATLTGTAAKPLLLISGTASVVGHASHHADDLDKQLDETLANLDSLLAAAAGHSPALPGRLSPAALLKVYLRHAEHAVEVERRLRQRLAPDTALLMLVGDICRGDLLIEIDGVQGVD